MSIIKHIGKVVIFYSRKDSLCAEDMIYQISYHPYTMVRKEAVHIENPGGLAHLRGFCVTYGINTIILCLLAL